MKKSVVLALSLLASIFSFCQTQVLIEDTLRSMSKGRFNGFITVVPKAVLKDIEKDWAKYLAEGGKAKPVAVNGEINMVGALVKNISPKPLNIYSKLLETLDGVKLSAWFTENDSVFISKDSIGEQRLAVQKYLRDFVIRELKQTATAELNNEKDKQFSLEKELSSLIKLEEKSNKKINENQRAIEQAKEETTSINSDVQRKDDQIYAQKEMVQSTATDANANKGAKQTLKNLGKDKKKLRKQIELLSKNIDRLNTQIRDEQRNIANVKQQQELKISDLEKQKQIIRNGEGKLNSIQ